MPAHKSALKRLKQSKRRHLRNIETKTALKTLAHQFNDLITNNKKDEAAKLLPKIASHLDKAAKRGIIHGNTADRKKSRLSLKLGKAAAAK